MSATKCRRCGKVFQDGEFEAYELHARAECDDRPSTLTKLLLEDARALARNLDRLRAAIEELEHAQADNDRRVSGK